MAATYRCNCTGDVRSATVSRFFVRKHQIPSTSEALNSKFQIATFCFGAWELKIPWCLEFGTWIFRDVLCRGWLNILYEGGVELRNVS